MTPPKRRRQPRRHTKHRKAVRRRRDRRLKELDKLSPVLRANRPAVKIPLKDSQIAALRELAREHGTTVETEIDMAIDAYCLGVTRVDIPWLTEFFTRFNAALERNNVVLDQTLREVGKSNARLARRERSRKSRRR